MRPPLPPTFTGELTGHNRRIGTLEKSNTGVARRRVERAQLRIHPAVNRSVVALNEAEENGINYDVSGFSMFGIYWSDWYMPTVPVTYTELVIEGPGVTFEDDTPPDRWRVTIEIANPTSVLASQVPRGATYERDYRPGDDQGTTNVITFDVPYPQTTALQPVVVKLPTPILVTQHQQIRVVRWHQTWEPTIDEIGPFAPYGTRWPYVMIWDSERTDTRTYDLYRYVTDVPWILTGEASKPITAEVQSVAGMIIERQGPDSAI